MEKFQSINQLRNTLKYIKSAAKYNEKPLPVIKYKATVKIHGTNAGVEINADGTVRVMSRNNYVDGADNNHFGFTNFVEEREQLFREVANHYGVGREGIAKVVIYGEWFGKGIQKGVAVSEVEKAFAVFRVTLFKEDGSSVIDQHFHQTLYTFMPILNGHRIYFIDQFGTKHFRVDVSDINNLHKWRNELVEDVNFIEQECPVGKFFGVKGIGEGIVLTPVEYPDWLTNYEAMVFKVKGEKHSSSKVKKLAAVDTEKVENITKFVDYAVTKARVEQAIFELGINIKEEDEPRSRVGEIIRWVISDVLKEESDVMEDNKITTKELGKYAPQKVRDTYFNIIEETE